MLLKTLKPEKYELRYSRIITFDIETKDGLRGTKFWLSSVATDSQTITFYTVKDLVDYFRMLKKNKLIFAHNLGFDGRFIIDFCSKNGIQYDITFYSAGILQIKIKSYRNEWITIRDSFALFPLAQDKLLESFHMEKKIFVDFEHEKDVEVIKKRCEYDAYSLREVLIKINKMFYEKFSVNALKKLTTSKLALTVFRTHFLKHSLENPYLEYNPYTDRVAVDYEKYEFVRSSYAGGRVEVFDLNKHSNVKSYDINSLYPYVMAISRIPSKRFHFVKHTDVSTFIQEFLYEYEGFVDIVVKVKDNVKYPILWKRIDGKLIFPVGTFQNVFTFYEIRKALEYSQIEILEVKQFYYAEVSENIFSEYVKTLYNMRKEMKKSKNPFQIVVKLLLNSLYGKFGQKPEKNEFKIAHSFEEFEDYVEAGYELLDMELMVFTAKTEKYNNFMIVHIASYITAIARCTLTEKMLELEKEDKNVLYCDTDSIFTTAHFETSLELGGWKLEFESDVFKAYAPKMYFSGKKKGAKGIPKNLVRSVQTLEEYEELIHSNIHYEKYASIKTMFRRVNKIVKTSKMLGYVITDKQFKLNYDKRVVHDDLTTSPIKLTLS